MQRLRLRRWQKRALDQFLRERGRDMLVVATPGAGKTIAALMMVLHDLRDHPHRVVFVVTPTRQLKRQWANEAAAFGLQLEPEWSGGAIPGDAHGVVMTFAQCASQAERLAHLSVDAAVILDEVHHAGDELTWGDGIATAFARAAARIAISGTPFRRDDAPIPFVTYGDDGEAQADYVYGYADALDDGGVVRPVFFPRIGGDMEWTAKDGAHLAATFEDDLTSDLAAQRLRTALDPGGGWLRDTLHQAQRRLERVRERRPDAGGIVFCMDQSHARTVARMLREDMGASAVVSVSDDPDSDRVAEEFKTASTQWICSVRKTSEGYDAKRLAVAVYATNVTSPLYFEQAVGRVMRWREADGPRQAAWFYIPDDPRLRSLVSSLREQRVHVLRKREDEADDDRAPILPEHAEQVSLFSAISSAASGVTGDAADDDPRWAVPALGARDPDDPTLEVDVPMPPRTTSEWLDAAPSYRRRRQLRDSNHDRVLHIVRITGHGHDAVNARLNDRAGIRSVSDATVRDLERRLREADRWLRSL